MDGVWGYQHPKTLRVDGRQSNLQLRPINCEFNVLCNASGSARFQLGNTSVLAAIHGPKDGATERKRLLPNQGTLQVVVRSFSNSSNEEKYMEACLESLLKSMIDFKAIIRTYTLVTVHVEENDSGILSCMSNAVVCAAITAGLPCHSTLTTVPLIVKIEKNDSDNLCSQQTCLVDPNITELVTDEKSMLISTYFAYTFNPAKNCLIQIMPECFPAVQRQSFNTSLDDCYLSVLNTANAASQVVLSKIRDQLTKHMETRVLHLLKPLSNKS